MRIGAIVFAVAVGVFPAACAHPAPTADPPIGAVEADSSSATPSVTAQAVQMGATVDIATASGTASYTVANWGPVPGDAQIIPAKGAMYSVDVKIFGRSGSTPVNGFYFAVRNADGSTVAPAVGAVRPGITYGQLTQGQWVEGHVAFDLTPGSAVTGVGLRDPGGTPLAFWSVN